MVLCLHLRDDNTPSFYVQVSRNGDHHVKARVQFAIHFSRMEGFHSKPS